MIKNYKLRQIVQLSAFNSIFNFKFKILNLNNVFQKNKINIFLATDLFLLTLFNFVRGWSYLHLLKLFFVPYILRKKLIFFSQLLSQVRIPFLPFEHWHNWNWIDLIIKYSWWIKYELIWQSRNERLMSNLIIKYSWWIIKYELIWKSRDERKTARPGE